MTEHLNITRCYNCCGIGHLKKDCRSRITCGRCSSEHSFKDCKSSEYKCINRVNYNKSYKSNMSFDYLATDYKCLVYMNNVNNFKGRINYG